MSKNDIPELDFVSLDGDFAALMEESVDKLQKDFKPGDKIEGLVTMITENSVFVEMNGKSEGILPKVEFLEGDEFKVQEGDKVTAYFVSGAGGENSLTLRMSGDALHDTIGEAFANQVPVEGKVLEERKGGYSVSLSGINAFCPFSQMDLRSGDPSMYVGETFSFIITRMTDFDTVVSRRPLLEAEADLRRNELEDTLSEGDVLTGAVRKIETFGVFVNLGGVDGLIPMGEISWERNFDVNSFVKVGDDVTVTVKKLDWERNRIVLSLKECAENPWEKELAFESNVAIKGTVTRVESYGAFVEIKPGIEGLCHVSKLGKGKRLSHAAEVVAEGEEIEVFVLDVNTESRRISLSLEDEEHDFEGHEKSGVPVGHSNAVHVGNNLTGSVDGIKRFGVFVKLNDHKKGLIHISMLDAPKSADPLKFLTGKYKEGDAIEVEILHIDGGRISLGLPGSTSEAENSASVQKYIKKNKADSFGSLGDMFGGLDL